MNPFETDLDKNAANFVPLSPLGFLARSAAIYPERTAIIHGARRYDWAEAYRRCRRLASALARRGIGKGDTVAIMAPNRVIPYPTHSAIMTWDAVKKTRFMPRLWRSGDGFNNIISRTPRQIYMATRPESQARR